MGKSSQNSLIPVLLFWSSRPYTICILFVYTFVKVVSYYDLSVLSISVMGFKKMWSGWSEIYPVLFGFFEFF